MVEVADEAAPLLVVLGLSGLSRPSSKLSLLVLPAPPYKGGGPSYKSGPFRTLLIYYKLAR